MWSSYMCAVCFLHVCLFCIVISVCAFVCVGCEHQVLLLVASLQWPGPDRPSSGPLPPCASLLMTALLSTDSSPAALKGLSAHSSRARQYNRAPVYCLYTGEKACSTVVSFFFVLF